MGDNAEFEKLTTLEARLAAALDRIAVGLGEAMATPPAGMEDPGVTSGALEDAQIRADAAEARVAELQQHLAHLQSQAAPEVDPAEFSALQADRDSLAEHANALQAARATDQQEAAETLAARDAELDALRAEVETLKAAPADTDTADDTATIDRLKARITELEAAVEKARSERDAAQTERDEARDIAEEMQAASGAEPDARALALRTELAELREMNERLSHNVTRLRGEKASDPRVLNKSLVLELDALKAARASEAAELERILADLDAEPVEGGAHA